MEKLSLTAVIPQLLRNIIIAVVVFTDESLLQISRNSKFLQKLRLFLVTCFLFFLSSLPSVIPFTKPGFKITKQKKLEISDCAESGIGRTISQLLSAMNEIPVNSRKYEVVRLLAEKLIEENHEENSIALFDLNRRVLNASFHRTLSLLEASVKRNRKDTSEPIRRGLNRMVRAALRVVGDGITGEETANQSSETTEKLAAELLWLAEKMAAYGFIDEAVEKWASASNLAWLALWSEPRLQCSLVQISALLLKEANKEKGMRREEEEAEKKKWRRLIKKKMVISWLPLLCEASNGGDKPVLNSGERRQVEKVLEKIISELLEDEQEQVLSLWLHHYTHSSSSDWPNLNTCYLRWCHSSRQLLLLHSQNNLFVYGEESFVSHKLKHAIIETFEIIDTFEGPKNTPEFYDFLVLNRPACFSNMVDNLPVVVP